MADIRGIPVTEAFLMGRLIAAAGIAAGFTPGHRYWPLALAVDSTPVPPAVYVLTADDNGVLRALLTSSFLFAVDNLAP